MVYESFFGPYEQFSGLKCVICGEVIDPIILQNRQLMKDGGMLIPKEQGMRPKIYHCIRAYSPNGEDRNV